MPGLPVGSGVSVSGGVAGGGFRLVYGGEAAETSLDGDHAAAAAALTGRLTDVRRLAPGG